MKPRLTLTVYGNRRGWFCDDGFRRSWGETPTVAYYIWKCCIGKNI